MHRCEQPYPQNEVFREVSSPKLLTAAYYITAGKIDDCLQVCVALASSKAKPKNFPNEDQYYKAKDNQLSNSTDI